MRSEEHDNAKAAVLAALLNGEWKTTAELCNPDVGGTEGTRRLREIRKAVEAGKLPPWKSIEMEKVPKSTQYRYRLSEKAIAPKPELVAYDIQMPEDMEGLSRYFVENKIVSQWSMKKFLKNKEYPNFRSRSTLGLLMEHMAMYAGEANWRMGFDKVWYVEVHWPNKPTYRYEGNTRLETLILCLHHRKAVGALPDVPRDAELVRAVSSPIHMARSTGGSGVSFVCDPDDGHRDHMWGSENKKFASQDVHIAITGERWIHRHQYGITCPECLKRLK